MAYVYPKCCQRQYKLRLKCLYTTQNNLRVNELNGSNIMRNTNDTIIANSNTRLYDLYTETHVTSSKNVFNSFSNVLPPYFLNTVDI